MFKYITKTFFTRLPRYITLDIVLNIKKKFNRKRIPLNILLQSFTIFKILFLLDKPVILKSLKKVF